MLGKSPFRIILVLNATERDRTQVALIAEKETFIIDEPVRSQELPKLIEQVLKKAGLEIKSIKAIAVNNQPGSLTGVRIAITVANTLAWDLHIPIIEFQTDDLTKAVKDLRDWSEEKYVKIASVKL